MSHYVYEYAITRKKVLTVAEDHQADGPGDVAALARDLGLHQLEQERLVVLLLDSKNRVKGTYTVSVGLLDRALAHPREVFRIAIEKAAARIILVHNHPSGDPTPSRQDKACTEQIHKAGKIIGIELLDHLIVVDRPPEAGKNHFSFREAQLLEAA
jgi:DNA repair protein RadC